MSASTNRDLLRARDLVDLRFAERLSVDELGRSALMSPAHFSRQFASAFGETPHRYLLSRRLERATWLLETSEHSVEGVSRRVGWRSVGSFTSTFSRVYGVAPATYRARARGGPAVPYVPSCFRRVWMRPRDVSGV